MDKKTLVDKTILGIPEIEKGIMNPYRLCHTQLEHAIPIITGVVFDEVLAFIHSRAVIRDTVVLTGLAEELKVFKGRYL